MINEKMLQLGTARSVIRELFEYGKTRAAEIGYENVFDYSLGNPSVPAPSKLNETAIDLLTNFDSVALHGYTSAQGDAKSLQMVADSLNSRFRLKDNKVSASNLYFTVGAAAGLCSVLHGICNEGDEVIVIAPYFPEYKVFIEKTGAKMVLIPADTQAFQIDFEKLEAAITKRTKAVLINTPNNPSGNIYFADTLTKLGNLLKEKSERYEEPIYLLSDEPYRELIFAGVEAPYVPDFYDNSIIIYSWSKALSIPGERLGYFLVPDSVEDSQMVYAACAGAARALGYVCAPGLFQRVCAICANDVSDISVYETNKTILMRGLTDLGFEIVEPQGTFYMFPKTLIPDDISFCNKAKEFDILIVPGTGFGCPGHCRLSYCIPTEKVIRSLEAFRKLAEYYKYNS